MSSSVSSARLSQPFPYKYTPISPFLFQTIQRPFFYYLTLPIWILLSPLAFMLKFTLLMLNFAQFLIVTKIFFFWPHFQIVYTQFTCLISLLIQGNFPLKTSKIEQKAEIIVANHTNLNDVNIGIWSAQAGFLSKSEMRTVPVVSHAAKILNTVYVDRKTGKNDLNERKADNPIIIFPEGTITNRKVLMRFKTGAFRLKDEVQPLLIQYKSLFQIEWLTEHAFTHIYCLFTSPFSFTDYRFLDVMKREENETYQQFADRVGRKMAEEMGVVYLPYSVDDFLYYQGLKDIEKCSTEYLQDYGWMGNHVHYHQICRQQGLNPLFEHRKQQFKEDQYISQENESLDIVDQRLGNQSRKINQ